MDLTAITLTELRYVVAVAELGHFGRAADACHVTQPTLSTQVKKLEDTLGVRLFERRPGRVRPTAAGRAIVARAQDVLAQVRAIGDIARGHGDPLTGPLRLGIIPTLGPYVLPWMVPRLQTAFPALRFVVQEAMTTQLLADVEHARLDAAMVALPVRAPALASEALFDEPFWLLAPAAHALATRARVAERDLDGHCVLLLTEGHCLRDQALVLCGRAPEANGGDFRATSLETLRHLVAAGLGVTLLPSLAVPALATTPAVAARPFRAPAPGRRVGLVWRREDPHADALRRLAAAVRLHLPDGVRAVAGDTPAGIRVLEPAAARGATLARRGRRAG